MSFRTVIHKVNLWLLVGFLLSSFFLLPKSVQASATIVNPHQVYSYKVMERDIEGLAAAYPDLVSYESLGQTRYGRNLWAVKLGRGQSVLFLNGSHHAREWMTTSLVMKMIDTYASAYYTNEKVANYNIRSLLDSVSIWVVPMVNPDGVTLAQQGTAGLPESLAIALRKYNGNSTNFTRWKANMQGIDLNRQYPASWNTIRNAASYPSYQNYKGIRPAQAPEVQMMMDFTYKIDPEITISYHSSGEIIFWNFNTAKSRLVRDKKIAADLNKLTGYSLVQPERYPSGGGYKDWFIQEFGRPGFTLEIGQYAGEGNLPLSAFNGIWAENKEVGLYSAKKSYELWLEKQGVQYLQKSMSLLAETELYFKIGATGSVAHLDPQEVGVTARKGDWYQVSTEKGSGWIHPAPGVLAVVENLAATADLKGSTPVYKYPDPFSPKVTFLGPQTVQVKGRWGTWLLVSTGSGKWWLDGKGVELQKPAEKVEPSIEPIEAVTETEPGQEQPSTAETP